jgi:ubiquinone/menaquinone biosynthesis C-methylase UbiE
MFARAMASVRLWARLLAAALVSKSNREFYDRIAPVYDQVFVTHELHANTIADVLLERYKGVEKSALVLDLGCGTGLLSKILVAKGFEMLGLDISFESLRLLHQGKSRVSTVQADAVRVPLIDASCHAVVSLGAWRHFPDLRQVVTEVARILKGDGMLIVGYFPPAIGGVIHQGDGLWCRSLARLYQFLIRKRGYVDDTDLSLESRTVRLAGKYFSQVETVASGDRWRLIVAQGQKCA